MYPFVFRFAILDVHSGTYEMLCTQDCKTQFIVEVKDPFYC